MVSKPMMMACCLWAAAVLAEPPPNYPFVNFDAGLKAARASGKPIFLYFWPLRVCLERDETRGTRIRYVRGVPR